MLLQQCYHIVNGEFPVLPPKRAKVVTAPRDLPPTRSVAPEERDRNLARDPWLARRINRVALAVTAGFMAKLSNSRSAATRIRPVDDVDSVDQGTVGPAMSARKGKALSPAFLANTWRPGQSGNPGGHSGLYGEAVKLARGLSLRAVQRLGELMESEDERVSVVACNALLDRAFGKPKPAVEEKDDMDAQLASMTREERLALIQQLLEPMRKYLPPGEREAETIEPETTGDDSVEVEADD